MQLQQKYLAEPVSTIYFGGGTPSILSIESIKRLLQTLHETFTVDTQKEITLEANPDDITYANLLSWKQAGITRLSIGVQSFFEQDLQWMNRAHNALQAVESIKMATNAGFNNITIDLIYGTPGLSDEHWHYNVHKAIELGVPHLSCYALTVEPKTALEKMIAQNKVANVDADTQARHFELLTTWLQQAGYEHYEISNFAKPGYRSRHNSSYWQGAAYLGLGPSAHSFNGISRQWNVANNALYIKSIQNGIVPFEIEMLTSTQQYNEYIMTSLRTIEGVSLAKVSDTFGDAQYQQLLQGAQPHIAQNNLCILNNRLHVTKQGRFFSDGIAADLFVV